MYSKEELELKLVPGSLFTTWEEVTEIIQEFLSHRIVYSLHKGTKLEFDNPCIYEVVEFRCKFGVRIRKTCQTRQNQRYYGALNCNSRIRMRYQKKDKTLKITFSCFEHKDEDGNTHDLNRDTLGHLPEIRKLTTEQQTYISTVKPLGVSRGKVAHELRTQESLRHDQQYLTSRDVGNYINKLDNIKNISEVERVMCLLETEKRKGAHVVCTVDTHTSELNHVFYQSKKMNDSAKIYNNVVLLDGTYRLSNSGYILYAWLGVDNYLKGRFLAWSLVSSEKADIISAALEAFMNKNSQCCNETKTLIVDKSFTELSALDELESKIPNANIILCAVHTWRNFEKMVHCLKWSNTEHECLMKTDLKHFLETYSKDPSTRRAERRKQDKSRDQIMKDYLRSVLHILLNTTDLSLFSKTYNTLIDCPYLPGKFLDDFKANWGECRDKWAKSYRNEINNLIIDDNNRIESFNHKIKQSVSSLYTSLDKVIISLLKFEEQHYVLVNNTLFADIMKPRVTKAGDEPQLSVAYRHLSQPVIKLIENEFQKMSDITWKEAEQEQDSSKIWTGTEGNDLTVIVGMGDCSCSFFKQLMLPCRHIMAKNTASGFKAVMKSDLLNRWITVPTGFQIDERKRDNDVNVSDEIETQKLQESSSGPITDSIPHPESSIHTAQFAQNQ